jgi:hypothetical protein
MLTLSPNSKKCSAAKLFAAFVCLSSAAQAWAAPPLHVNVKPTLGAPTASQLRAELRQTLGKKGGSFAPLLAQWEARYGSTAVPGLLSIAQDRANTDSDRFVALMGTTRLGGSETAPYLVPFLKDSSWMLRSGALRALSAIQSPQIRIPASAVLPLLNDSALVVRSEAIDAVVALKLPGAGVALLGVLEQRSNYLSSGKPLWVPGKALAALRSLGPAVARDALPGLREWAKTKARAELLPAARETIQVLEQP